MPRKGMVMMITVVAIKEVVAVSFVWGGIVCERTDGRSGGRNREWEKLRSEKTDGQAARGRSNGRMHANTDQQMDRSQASVQGFDTNHR